MEDWKISQFYDDGHTEYSTYIGGYRVVITQLVGSKGGHKKSHWAYQALNFETSHMFSGNRFPWSAQQAMDYVVLVLSLNAFSRVLKKTDQIEHYPIKNWMLYNEDDLDRV